MSIDNIGLAFSGGGFRAATFALGSLSYLQRLHLQGKPLLQRVSFISSTSGGSLTNAFYTLRLYQGQEPASIFKELYAHLSGDQILERALACLTNPAAWAAYPHKTRNLINAFAITYDQILFEGKTMEVFWNKARQPHVEEVCFNSTELNNGISFRFRTNGTDADIVSFGNYYLGFKKESVDALRSLRIADMVAASSCFPVGFEPIVFPNDFAAGEQTPASLLEAFEFDHNDALRRDEVQTLAFGLIDGGVVDNQGLYSLGLEDNLRPPLHARKAGLDAQADAGKAGARPFDLLIACDVASYFLDPYAVPSESSAWLLRIQLKWIVIALAMIVPLTAVTVGIFAARHEPWYYYLLLLPAYLSSGLIGLGFWKMAKALR
ncbi:MAG TPA: patatin-like phospholipase family protein, partial [Bacteroidia bacterium]|nr:patatin-like phospholipase family protein [Bacteroidia bacterium]